jgi:hypothetical protein
MWGWLKLNCRNWETSCGEILICSGDLRHQRHIEKKINPPQLKTTMRKKCPFVVERFLIMAGEMLA